MIQLPEIFAIQARAQRATLKGELDKAIAMLKRAAEMYQELLDNIDQEDQDNTNLIKSVESIRSQVLKRTKELEILVRSKQESIGSSNTKTLTNSGEQNVENDDLFKRQVSKLIKNIAGDKKLDSTIVDLRQKLKILKINGNNIDLVTTPEQKLKYENDLLNKIQLNYDLKLEKFDKFYQTLILLVNNSNVDLNLDFPLVNDNENSNDNDKDDADGSSYDDNDTVNETDTSKVLLKKQVELLGKENQELKNQVDKLNKRWNELVESAKKRKERESNR